MKKKGDTLKLMTEKLNIWKSQDTEPGAVKQTMRAVHQNGAEPGSLSDL